MAGTVVVDAVKSSTTGAPTFQNTSGTEIGTLCRAWVNFNGTGTVAIRSSFNVSSITDNGVGDYTVNFTTAMPDANYAVCGSGSLQGSTSTNGGNVLATGRNAAPTTTAVRVETINPGTATPDTLYVSVAIFR